MSYDLNTMFNPSVQHAGLWNPQSYKTSGYHMVNIVGNGSAYGNAMGAMELTPKAETINGYGKLTWLSAKAGLITCANNMVISFQLKDFCDQLLPDLTSVLRVGFTLSFQAALNETNEYTATLVQPLYGSEAARVFVDKAEVDLEAACPTPPNSKDAYCPKYESRAIPSLLTIFQRHGSTRVPLSSLHSQMSNCGDDELIRYVGTSSLKRRQFVERRTHLFILGGDDTVQLQDPHVYICVLRLATFLLCHGGATAIQTLYEYFIGNEMPSDIRSWIGEGRQEFLNLIVGHPWIFALFPNKTFVSVRRNLPHFDYPGFVKGAFPEASGRIRQSSRFEPTVARPIGLSRSMSTNQAFNGYYMDQGRQSMDLFPNSASNTPIMPLATPGSTRDQWSPLPSPWSRSSDYPGLNGTGGVIGSSLKASQISVSTQTEQPRNNSSSCTCGCTCGVRNNLLSRGNSASPPSLDSNSPNVDRLTPGSGPNPIGDKADPQPIKYYDPFGTESLLSGLSSFSLN